MSLERQSRLPECVGKKIVEALKQEQVDVQHTDVNSADEKIDNTQVQSEPAVKNINAFNFSMPAQKFETVESNKKIEITDLELPDNVMMLVNLINQLPAGVNRQVGAQIIRQTIEAMGISMKSVLSEAQYIQEDLGNSIQDCTNTIEEYKNNIKVLDKKISSYKRQATQLGDLINLFVMTIK